MENVYTTPWKPLFLTSFQTSQLSLCLAMPKRASRIEAEGSYANSLVTNNAVYLPFFANQTSNERAFAVFKNNTKKEVIPVYNAGKVPVLGGSLRCMTWQIDQEHPVAKALFAYVNRKPSGSSAIAAQVAVIMLFLQLSFALASYH